MGRFMQEIVRYQELKEPKRWAMRYHVVLLLLINMFAFQISISKASIKPMSSVVKNGKSNIRNYKMRDWTLVNHFTKDENWGNPFLINEDLIYKLDGFRKELGVPIIITCGTQGKHKAGSFHYTGDAVDFVIADRCALDPLDIAFLALRFGFSGIGYYPHWKLWGKEVGGWHLDLTTKRKAMWLGVMEKGEQAYRRFSGKNLKKYGIL